MERTGREGNWSDLWILIVVDDDRSPLPFDRQVLTVVGPSCHKRRQLLSELEGRKVKCSITIDGRGFRRREERQVMVNDDGPKKKRKKKLRRPRVLCKIQGVQYSKHSM